MKPSTKGKRHDKPLPENPALAEQRAGVKVLGTHIEVMDFISNQYRHGKTILALGDSKALMERADVSSTLASGDADPGIMMAAAAKVDGAVADFIAALGRHRHPERETWPPPACVDINQLLV